MTIVQQKDTTYTKLFVGGLPYHTTDQSLREYFKQFGDIDEAVVITDRQTGKSRGYGFVTMAERSAAERICKDPNPIIDGRKANVNLAYLGAKPRIQATELLAALPFGLKAGFGLPGCSFGGQLLGFPQHIYPTAAYFAASPGAAYPLASPYAPAAQSAVGPVLPSAAPAAGQFFDYAAALHGCYGPATVSGGSATMHSPTGYETSVGGNPYAIAAAFGQPGAVSAAGGGGVGAGTYLVATAAGPATAAMMGAHDGGLACPGTLYTTTPYVGPPQPMTHFPTAIHYQQ